MSNGKICDQDPRSIIRDRVPLNVLKHKTTFSLSIQAIRVSGYAPLAAGHKAFCDAGWSLPKFSFNDLNLQLLEMSWSGQEVLPPSAESESSRA